MPTNLPLAPNQRSGGFWLRWLNLRPEESERTFLMFAFYTLTSIGILWLEVSVAALFLGEYGAESLPWIYVASAVIGASFGFLYSWLQRFLALRQVIVLTAVLMALPLFLFRLDLNLALLGGYTIFLMRLWLEAIYVLNEVNTSITANQLFTIREIKRTYPLISSGILAADVLSGLSLPPLRSLLGLPNMILLAGLMLCGGAAVLFYLTRAYSQSFPERQLADASEEFTQRSQGKLRHYLLLLVAFFVLLQVLLLLIDFQYLSQLEQNVDVDQIADFLALFGAGLGVVELATQWFVSGRVIERFGIFRVAQFSPLVILGLSCLALTQLLPLFVGAVLLKFIDELLRYTLVASTSPVLFQPLPEAQRDRIQANVRGIAEPVVTGLTGLVMLGIIWAFRHLPSQIAPEAKQWQSLLFLGLTALLAWGWLRTVQQLRSNYLEVLVLSADWGQLQLSQVDAQGLRRELEEVLNRPEQDFDKEAYIELLIRTDPKTASQILAPLLLSLSPDLQRQVLAVMLDYPNPSYTDAVRSLTQTAPPEVLAAALRYLWRDQSDLTLRPNLNPLRAYCRPSVNPAVRSTAAALIMRQGQARDQVEAVDVLRRMLTHRQEQERLMGCRALGDTGYLQSLRLYIKPLLRDPSLAVRCAVLEAIATTQAEDYYGALLKGLYAKSTRAAARQALIKLENDALPMLQKLAEDAYQPMLVRRSAWQAIGEIRTPEAINALIGQLLTAWGSNREMLLQVLLKLPQERGIDAVSNQLGRSGIETLMAQELQFLSHLYAGRLDLRLDLPELPGSLQSLGLLHRALQNLAADAEERLFLLMQLLYDPNQVRAAAFSLQSESREDRARGLEILDNLLDIPKKRTLINLLDAATDAERLQYLAEFAPYRPMPPQQRLRYLVELRHFLSDWGLSCCFHLAREAHWSLSASQTFACLKSPTGFVREAVLAYLRLAPKALMQALPAMNQDANPLVRAQINQIMAELGLTAPGLPQLPAPKLSADSQRHSDPDLQQA